MSLALQIWLALLATASFLSFRDAAVHPIWRQRFISAFLGAGLLVAFIAELVEQLQEVPK